MCIYRSDRLTRSQSQYSGKTLIEANAHLAALLVETTHSSDWSECDNEWLHMGNSLVENEADNLVSKTDQWF